MSEYLNGPPGAVFIDGEWIRVNNEGKVVIYEPITDDEPETQRATNSTIPHAEIEIKIKGHGMEQVAQLLGMTANQQSMNAYPALQQMQFPVQRYTEVPVPTEQPRYMQPYNARQNELPDDFNDSWTVSELEEKEQLERERLEQQNSPVTKEVIIRKDSAAPMAIFITAAIAIALGAGPITQSIYAGPRVVEECKGDIFCEVGQFPSFAFNLQNLFNIIPPEQKK